MTERNEREQEVMRARAALGDERLLAFLAGVRNDDVLACQLIAHEIDAGRTLDAIFYTGEESGFTLNVEPLATDRFRVEFGCVAGPTEGDGGEWVVSFEADGAATVTATGRMWTA